MGEQSVEFPLNKILKDSSKVGHWSVGVTKTEFKSPPIPERAPAAWVKEPVVSKIKRTVKNTAVQAGWKVKQHLGK